MTYLHDLEREAARDERYADDAWRCDQPTYEPEDAIEQDTDADFTQRDGDPF